MTDGRSDLILKRLLSLLIAGALMLSAAGSVFAADGVEVYYNGEKKDFTVRVEQIDGTTLVPIRAVFELFNYKVEWDNTVSYTHL